AAPGRAAAEGGWVARLVRPRHRSVHRRPGRITPAAPEPWTDPAVDRRRMPDSWPYAPAADRQEWTLGRRARQLYLDPATLAGDLARIGLPVPVNQLDAILAGRECAPPVVLAGLVDTLELRDPAVHDRPLVLAVTRPWRSAGWLVPTEILTILATARNLSVSEVRDIAAHDTPTA
ncbi:MAG TPA: hypothetical protein VFP72_16680, partial [Kineosporiaceae bacterium]|nr:hypothetical protein [Kineosporiaceae bacterium]